VRTHPKTLLLGFAKLVAVVVAAGLAGAGIGIALSKLSGNDSSGEPLLPATTSPAATSAAATRGSGESGYRAPRVQVLSAQLGPVSESTGRALVAVRARVTNRGRRALTITKPALISREDEVPLGTNARDAAGPLLQPIAPDGRATGTLRFAVPGRVAQRLSATPAARLRVASRTVIVKLATDEPSG